MSVLHGLRLNCLLAPLSVALVGIIAIGTAWSLQRSNLLTQQRDDDLAQIRGCAQLAEAGNAVPPQAWLAAHPQWQGMATLRLRGETVELLASAGSVTPPRETTQDLLLSYQRPRRWRLGVHWVVAAAILPTVEQPSLLVAWRSDPLMPPTWPWRLQAGGMVVVGGGLGTYLVARVYRPVAWCERAAAVAAAGGEIPGNAPDGPETASLRSSIATLIAKRKHSDLADPKPDA